MRRILLVLSLATLTIIAGAGDAHAQRRGFGYGGGLSPGISIGVGRVGSYSSYGYYGNGYSPYSYQNYGSAYQYAPSYYNLSPSYSLFPSTYGYTQPQIQQSFYPAPMTPVQSVAVTVLLPVANAQVWFQGAATSQQGTERVFQSPPLEANHAYTYTIKARWTESGRVVDQERQVSVQVGQNTTVNFRDRTSEAIPAPRD